MIGLPFRFLWNPTHTGRGAVADGITRRIGHEGWFAHGVIDGLSTGRIGGRGEGDAAADRPNDGTHRGDGVERGGLENSGLIIRFKERLVLLGFDEVTGVHLGGQGANSDSE